MDAQQFQMLAQEISHAIRDGMANGAEHIATAIAGAKPQEQPGDLGYRMTFENGVTGAELAAACRTLAKAREEYGVYEQAVQPAWTTLRRALNLPT